MKLRNLLWSALVVGASVTALLTGCATLAIWSAPEKKASAERTDSAKRADDLFWKTLHDADYDHIGEALVAETAAYLENPNDPLTAAHVGWLHIWRLAERGRLATVPPGITDDAVLSRKYFEEAVRMNPSEARFLGFYGSILLAEGSIHKDEKMTRKGYYTLLDSIKAWPEFNYFTVGYSMSSRPYDNERFQEALDYQWKNLDVCVGERVDRQNPGYAKYMPQEVREGPKRVCWNSWIAPHNLEGFFLNFGDMLVKNGQPDLAVAMYGNAKLAKEYPQWKFRQVLEERIRDAQANVAAFRVANPKPGAPRIMNQSAFACSACHQN
jgi:hypothetical protein